MRWTVGDPAGHDAGGERLWLRRSITGTRGGQTHTIEIAVSVQSGMSAERIEVLLGEADACMHVLSRQLDNYWRELDDPEAISSTPPVERQLSADRAPVYSADRAPVYTSRAASSEPRRAGDTAYSETRSFGSPVGRDALG